MTLAIAVAVLIGQGMLASVASAASDQILVRSPGATAVERAEIADALDADSSTPLLAGWRVYDLSDPISAAAARRELAGTAATAVEEDGAVTALGSLDQFAPSDSQFLSSDGLVGQWGLYNWGQTGTGLSPAPLAGADVRAIAAWARARNGQPVIVATSDTGVRITHNELKNSIWTNTGEIAGNGIDDDHNGYVDDVNGWDFYNNDASVFDSSTSDSHGTSVAGVIAANRNAGAIAGVADNARIMPVKFMSGTTGATSAGIQTLIYARDNGAKVINMSWGTSTYSQALCDAVSSLAASGVVTVASDGNSGANTDSGSVNNYPSECPATALSVAATDTSDARWSGSNYGVATTDIAAPGYWINSVASGGNNSTGSSSGTSLAAPFVSGAAAMLLGQNPNLTAAQVTSAILGGAKVLPALSGVVGGGRRLDLVGALGRIGVLDTTAPTAFSVTSPVNSAQWVTSVPDVTWSAANDEEGVVRYEVLVDGVSIASGLSATTLAAPTLAGGEHAITVVASDLAGNTRSQSTSIRLDTGAPSAPVLGALAGQEPGPLALSWDPAVDPDGGEVTYSVLLNGTIAASGLTSPGWTSPSLAAGSYTVKVVAEDPAGNQSASAERGVVLAVAVPDPTPDPPTDPTPDPTPERILDPTPPVSPAPPTPAPVAPTPAPVFPPLAPEPIPVSEPVADPAPGSSGPGPVSLLSSAAGRVVLSLSPPSGATGVIVSRSANFAGARTSRLSSRLQLTLPAPKGKVTRARIYVRFAGVDSPVYPLVLTIDRAAPTVSARASYDMARNKTVLRVNPRDLGTGVDAVRLSGGPWVKTKGATVLSAPGRRALRVQVRDRAGNLSAWIQARRP